jgi:hypothetical protein
VKREAEEDGGRLSHLIHHNGAPPFCKSQTLESEFLNRISANIAALSGLQ